MIDEGENLRWLKPLPVFYVLFLALSLHIIHGSGPPITAMRKMPGFISGARRANYCVGGRGDEKVERKKFCALGGLIEKCAAPFLPGMWCCACIRRYGVGKFLFKSEFVDAF